VHPGELQHGCPRFHPVLYGARWWQALPVRGVRHGGTRLHFLLVRSLTAPPSLGRVTVGFLETLTG
jgi:hypothetical protein